MFKTFIIIITICFLSLCSSISKILITGGAGFIGFHLCNRLSKTKQFVVCIDNINDHYNTEYKKERVKNYVNGIIFENVDICDIKI